MHHDCISSARGNTGEGKICALSKGSIIQIVMPDLAPGIGLKVYRAHGSVGDT